MAIFNSNLLVYQRVGVETGFFPKYSWESRERSTTWDTRRISEFSRVAVLSLEGKCEEACLSKNSLDWKIQPIDVRAARTFENWFIFFLKSGLPHFLFVKYLSLGRQRSIITANRKRKLALCILRMGRGLWADTILTDIAWGRRSPTIQQSNLGWKVHQSEAHNLLKYGMKDKTSSWGIETNLWLGGLAV